jgi:hypothetical protein
MNAKIFYGFLFLSLPLAFLRCSGASLIGANSSGNLEVGTVEVLSLHELGDDQTLAANPDGHKELTNDLGYDLLLEEAQINWRSLRLISEGDDPECEPGQDQDIALDRVEDLLGEDLVEMILAQTSVPLVSYCRVEIVLAPTSASGSWAKGAASGDFELGGTEEVTVAGVFQAGEDGVVIDHPLHFHGEEMEAQVVFAVHYGELFAGMDFSVESPESLQAKLLDNLAHSVHQHQGTHD